MLADVRIKKWHLVHAKAACTSIKLISGSGSRLYPSSLVPHPCDQRTTNKCLPFSPATATTFLTWPRHSATGVMIQYGQVTATVHSKNIAWFHYIFSGMMVQVDHCYLRSKNVNLLSLFFSETIILWILWFGTKNDWHGKATLWGMMFPI
jgi:hypothetical protein